MIVLITDPFNRRQSEALTAAVVASGLKLDASHDLGTDPDVINRYRLGAVPCLARIHGGVAVDLIADDWAMGKSAATIKGRFTAAVNAVEAAKVVPVAPSTADRIAALETELAALKAGR